VFHSVHFIDKLSIVTTDRINETYLLKYNVIAGHIVSKFQASQ